MRCCVREARALHGLFCCCPDGGAVCLSVRGWGRRLSGVFISFVFFGTFLHILFMMSGGMALSRGFCGMLFIRFLIDWGGVCRMMC